MNSLLKLDNKHGYLKSIRDNSEKKNKSKIISKIMTNSKQNQLGSPSRQNMMK